LPVKWGDNILNMPPQTSAIIWEMNVSHPGFIELTETIIHIYIYEELFSKTL